MPLPVLVILKGITNSGMGAEVAGALGVSSLKLFRKEEKYTHPEPPGVISRASGLTDSYHEL